MTFTLVLPACLARWPVLSPLLSMKSQTVLYRQGECIQWVWIVRRGFVKIQRLSLSGKQVTLSLLGSTAILGDIELDQNGSYESATIQSSADVYRMDRNSFDHLLTNEPEFSRFVAQSLFLRKAALQRRLFSVMHRRVETRVAGLLCDLARNEGERCRHGAEVDVRLSQQDLADMIGASRQVVSSELNRLRAADLVHYSRNLICVTNLVGLNELAET